MRELVPPGCAGPVNWMDVAERHHMLGGQQRPGEAYKKRWDYLEMMRVV